MRLTLLKAKEALQHRSPADRLEFRINRAEERFINSGKWNGSLHTLGLVARYGEVALPRNYKTIEGVKVDGYVRDIVNHWYIYIPGKADTWGYSMGQVQDLDDGHPTMYGFPLGGRGYSSVPTATVTGDGNGATVRVRVANGAVIGAEVDNPGIGYTVATIAFSNDGGGFGAHAEATVSNGSLDTVTLKVTGTLRIPTNFESNLKMTIYGTDCNYLPVQLTLTDGTPVSNPFTRIDRIHRETGTASISLVHTDESGLVTPLAIMAPKEEEVYLRRYAIGGLTLTPESTVTALCKMRHVEFTSDQDILPIANLGALELGMDALQFEAENDMTLAAQYWAAGLKVLNDELKDSYAVDELPVIRFVYPGGTRPNLTSHY
jgi:hypothetical protein